MGYLRGWVNLERIPKEFEQIVARIELCPAGPPFKTSCPGRSHLFTDKINWKNDIKQAKLLNYNVNPRKKTNLDLVYIIYLQTKYVS